MSTSNTKSSLWQVEHKPSHNKSIHKLVFNSPDALPFDDCRLEVQELIYYEVPAYVTHQALIIHQSLNKSAESQTAASAKSTIVGQAIVALEQALARLREKEKALLQAEAEELAALAAGNASTTQF